MSCLLVCPLIILVIYDCEKKEEIEVGVGHLKSCLKGYKYYIDGYSKAYYKSYCKQYLEINCHIFKTKQSSTSFIFCVNFILFHFYINTFHFLLVGFNFLEIFPQSDLQAIFKFIHWKTSFKKLVILFLTLL